MKSAVQFFAFIAIGLLTASMAQATNSMEVIMDRADNASSPNLAFSVEVDIDLADETGVTGVSVMGGTTPITMTQDFGGGSQWFGEVEYTSLADLKSGLNGTWTITIAGTTPSSSSFTVSASTLVDGDFFATPTGLSPGQDATNVSRNTSFSWTDPTGGATPYVLGVSVGPVGSGEEEEISAPFGSLAVTDVMWTPTLSLYPGVNSFEVFYANVDSSFVTALSLDSGTITWGNSSFAPTGAPFGPWPASTPLFVLGSFTEVKFATAPLVEDFESYSVQSDVTGPVDFLVTTTGNLADPVVASAAEALANSGGVADDGGDNVWNLGSVGGSTGTSGGTAGFVLIGDLPGVGATAGPFAEFFANPRALFSHSFVAQVRETTGAEQTQFRFLVTDSSANEAVSSLLPLSTSFAQHSAASFDFSDLPSNSNPTDFQQIVGLGFEFFIEPASPTTASALQFQVDDVELVPEPTASLLGVSALTCLALVARARRRRNHSLSTLHPPTGGFTRYPYSHLERERSRRVARGSHPPRALARSGQGDCHHPAPPLMRLVVTHPRSEP